MPTQKDLARLVSAYQRVQRNLDKDRGMLAKLLTGKPERKAAAILCKELSWFVNERDGWWREMEQESHALRRHRGEEKALLQNVERLIEQEAAICARLKVDKNTSRDIVSLTYDAFALLGKQRHEDPSPEGFRNLRDRLTTATDLICKASRGAVKRTFDKLIGRKGARILAGGAIATANLYVAIHADGGALSWVSVKVAYNVMKGDVEGVIDVLTD